MEGSARDEIEPTQGKIEYQNKHPSWGECGPDGGLGSGTRDGGGGRGPLSGIPSSLSGIPSLYLVSNPINESPKWNSSLLDILNIRQNSFRKNCIIQFLTNQFWLEFVNCETHCVKLDLFQAEQSLEERKIILQGIIIFQSSSKLLRRKSYDNGQEMTRL